MEGRRFHVPNSRAGQDVRGVVVLNFPPPGDGGDVQPYMPFSSDTATGGSQTLNFLEQYLLRRRQGELTERVFVVDMFPVEFPARRSPFG
jgi:hypothetical protein